MILFRRVSQSYGKHPALQDLSFSVDRAEVVALVGPNGSGKTTSLKAAAGLLRPTSGEVWFGGTDLTKLSDEEIRPLRRRMQMVFQDPFSSLNPRMTVGETVAEPMLVHGLAANADESRAKAAELFGIVGLDPGMLDRYPHEFSGGQRQRIGIARSLAAQPDFIVCD